MIARRIRAGLLAYGLSPAPAEVLSRYCDALLEIGRASCRERV